MLVGTIQYLKQSRRSGNNGDPNTPLSPARACPLLHVLPKNVQIVYLQIHGFSDASEDAYAGVVYFRMVDLAGAVHTSLVVSKTKVSPIKRLSIHVPRLELCGAQVLARLLHYVKEIFQVKLSEVYA